MGRGEGEEEGKSETEILQPGEGEGAGETTVPIVSRLKSSSKSGKDIWHDIQSHPASGE